MGNRLSIAFVALFISFFAANSFAAEGRTAGQFAVSPTGSAQYTIPIWTPPGPRGIQPNLALVYDSRSGIGSMGVGWRVAGLGAITRCNKTYAQDTIPVPVALVASDGYCLNGNRLRLTGGTYGAANSTYQTEIADFSNVTANGAAGNGPSYFTVQGRDGLTYEYGFTDSNGNGANSQVIAAPTSTAAAWLLSKVIDRAGNNLVVNYTSLTGTAVPNTILWTPTSAGALTYAYKVQFNYTTNVPQSSLTKYIGGTAVSDNQLLSSISVSSSGTVVKDYFLTYQASPTTGRDELKTVKECADSAQSNCLLPTSITYQNGAAGVSTTATTALASSGTNLTARYDLNGDGIPDLIYNPTGNGVWYVAFGSASGYGTPVNTGVTGSVLIGNLTGGSEDGILVNKSGTWWYYTWSGSSFTGSSTGIAYDSATYGYQLADVDGDGRPDLIDLDVTYNPVTNKSTAQVNTRLNTSIGSTASFSSTVTLAYSLGLLAGAQLQPPDSQWGKLRRYDFNGDGRDDLVLQVITDTTNYIVSTYELISTGTAFTASIIASTSGATYLPVFFTNWNDDACTDFVTAGTLYISGCNGTVPASYAVGTVVGAMDWDGDGRTDLVVANGASLGVYLSTGAGVATLLPTTIPYTSTCQYVTMDVKGDGLDDLGCWSATAPNPLTYYLHNGAGQPADLASQFKDGYGNSVSPTYVSIANSNYTNLTDAIPGYQNYIGPMYVVSQATFSDPSEAPGATYYDNYAYTGAWMNLQGRGFTVFAEVQQYDSRSALWEGFFYDRTFPFVGILDAYDMTQDQARTKHVQYNFIDRQYRLLDNTTNNQRYFPYIDSSLIQTYELGGTEDAELITTIGTTHTYDNYGNATNIVTTVTDTDPGSPPPYAGMTWTTNTTNTTDISVNQAADTAAWCLNMLDETQTMYSSTLPGSTSVTRTKTFTPDTPAECRIKTAVTEPTANSALYKVTEALTFDSFGNVQTDTVTGNSMPASPASRLTTLGWGTTGQFLSSITDPSGTTTAATYTSNQSLTFGVPDSVKNANNLTTSWLYDAFGRKTKETRPDTTSTTWTWSACTSFCGWSNSVYQVAQTAYQTNGTTAIRTDTVSFDPIDRITQSVGPTVTGANATVQKLYNSLGSLAQQSMPFLAGTPYLQTYNYDVLNRPISVSRPISSTNSTLQSTGYDYAGRTLTVTDPLGHKTITLTDVNGWLRKTTDALASPGYSVTRAYDSAGSLIGITDSVGNSLLKNVTYAYGIKPFLLAANDADGGPWSYTVDSLGERTGWTDAKGQAFSMTYDALSRALTRTEPDQFSQWTYGSTPASHNVGQLISECTGTAGACASSGSSETRTFDSLGRLSTRAIKDGPTMGNDPGGVYLFTSGYDTTTGSLKSLTYPISTSSFALTVQYAYQNGLLKSVTDTSDTVGTCGSSCTLWAANTMNAFGQVTQETLGNGVVMNRTYDAVTSWLTAATGGVGGGATLLNQSYLEDRDGNIIQRQNNNLGLTESFAYDADNRLTCAALSSTCTTSTLAYDGGVAGPGNITSQTGIGTYTYPAAGQPRPHAVTSIAGTFNGIVNPTFSYDANGNMTARASSTQNVYWMSSNYPSAISATDATGAETVSFAYGPDRQRVQQNFTSPAGSESTYYIGGLIDKVVFGSAIDYRHYIYAGAEPVAVYSRTLAGVNTMSYMLEDHQGGVSAITSKSGAADVNESFSAFGTRRNPTTWSGAPSTADLNTIASLSRQGYTFQTALGQSMGLNHMNGRMEDAILGRFLSADPHIPDPINTQSYNRYGYVNNNPVTFVDPTGFETETVSPVPKDGTLSEIVVEGAKDTGGIPNNFGYGPGGWVYEGVDGGILGAISIASRGSRNSGGSSGSGGGGASGPGEPKQKKAQSQDSLPEITVTAQKCTNTSSNGSFGDQVSDAIVGFGDAFLIPILVRNAFDIQGSVNYNSSAYNGGMIGGTIWGLVPFALEGAASYSAAQAARGTPSVLNANPYFRIGPGRWGGNMVPGRISSPYLPGDGHFSLSTRLPPIPPLGALASSGGC